MNIKRALASVLMAVALLVPTSGIALADDPTERTGYLNDESGSFTTAGMASGVDSDGFSTAEYSFTPLGTWSTKTYNRAGRPITGDSTDWCQGIGYGRVNTRLVLFTAAHCYVNMAATKAGSTVVYNNQPGEIVVETVTGYHIGTIGPVTYGAAIRDFGFIYLNNGVHPSDLSRVFRDEDGSGTKRWRTTTVPFPYNSESCDDMDNSGDDNGASLYQNWQDLLTTSYPNRTGTTVGFNHYTSASDCSLKTSIVAHGGATKDSGSGVYRGGVGNVPSFVGSSWWCLGTGPSRSDCVTTPKVVVTPIYSGLYNLDNYWQTHGLGYGAWFCFTPSCPGTDRTP